MGNRKDTVACRTAVLALLDDMITQQKAKCQQIANRLNPRLTPDDLMNPFDWPEVGENPQFAWEDGLLAGLQSAHAAIHAAFPENIPNGAPEANHEQPRTNEGQDPHRR